MALALAFLWFRLLNQLRIEWAVNPQYAYGWAVPVLCLLLLWRNLRPPAAPESPPAIDLCSSFYLPSSISLLLLGLASLAYLPTRLIQEANPDWRFVSWALAAEVIVITLVILRLMPDGRSQAADGGCWSAFRLPPSAFRFPILFFLVAVPWPTLIEGPLIQMLTRGNAGLSIELLNLVGIPALQRGNVIEISNGLVGIDDACSGIRSFQATLMISLFLGEWYRLRPGRRVGLVAAGFGLAFLFNVGRTLLLVTVAAKQGIAAIAAWHDPAGVTILVGCFVGLWLVGLGMARKQQSGISHQPSAISDQWAEAGGPRAERGAGAWFAVGLAGWILAVEVSTEWWYRAHERGLARAVGWQLVIPGDVSGAKELPMSENATRFLRYDTAQNVTWTDSGGSRWQTIFLQWNAGRVAAHLARSHTPEVCLSAAGHRLENVSEVRNMVDKGLTLPFRCYAFGSGESALFVFYCLREDRPRSAGFETESLSYGSRFDAVRAGRRNLGQRSLEVAVWGEPDAASAQAAFEKLLPQIIAVN